MKTLTQWLDEPSLEDTICRNPFREICVKLFHGAKVQDPGEELNPTGLPADNLYVKLGQLMMHQRILLAGDSVYVRDGDDLYPVGEATSLLAYYLHGDGREAKKAADILENNFMGYFPVTDDLVVRDTIKLDYGGGCIRTVDLKSFQDVDAAGRYVEFGCHGVDEAAFCALAEFFDVLDSAVREPGFFEKAMMYPFHQPFREKSFVLVGGGGNGKSMFMGLLGRLYGARAFTDAPQPNFKGHDPAVIAYNFVGKRVVTFNDVGDPSAQFLEWLKRMVTGNLEVKTPGGSWLSVPCNALFMLETNHTPEVLDLEAHRRRFIVREFDKGFRLKDELDSKTLDILGDRGPITAGDMANYMMTISPSVDDWASFQLRGGEDDVGTEEER